MPVKIFFCYAHEDELLLNELKLHLETFRRQGLIEMWYDRNISAGLEWANEIDKHLDTAKIILLLVSQYFMASDYCYGIEVMKAIKLHERRKAIVIPIILRPVHFQGAPFGKLQALPTDAKPVTSKSWANQDEAFYDVAEGIRKVLENLSLKSSSLLPTLPIQPTKTESISPQFLPKSDISQNEPVKRFSYLPQQPEYFQKERPPRSNFVIQPRQQMMPSPKLCKGEVRTIASQEQIVQA